MKSMELSRNVLKNVILSSVLEPIPEKAGCTTRYKTWQETSKLEYFLISGVNIDWDFYELSERVINNKFQQPSVIYDIAFNAQKNSFNNRHGGKINFGIIELMVPIITSQILYQDKNADDLLDSVNKVLKATTKEDVKWHLEFRKLAKSRAKMFPKTIQYNVPNMYEYYKLEKNELEDNVHHEFIQGFPRIKMVYQIFEEEKDDNLLDLSIFAYNKVLPLCNNYAGLAADYICIALYLYLTFYPERIIL